MSDADDHTMFAAITGQRKILISLCRHGDILNQTVCRFLILLELLHRGLDDILLRLRTLVNHIQIRTFKMCA